MRTKDNGKYNTAGNTGKKKCAAFNWLKGVTAVLCAVVMYFAGPSVSAAMICIRMPLPRSA